MLLVYDRRMYVRIRRIFIALFRGGKHLCLTGWGASAMASTIVSTIALTIASAIVSTIASEELVMGW